MPTQYFDDGSSLSFSEDYGYVASTPSTNGSVASAPTFPSGESILGALQNGFGRWIDYKTTQAAPALNVPTLPRNTAVAGGGLAISGNTLLLIGVGLGIWALAK